MRRINHKIIIKFWRACALMPNASRSISFVRRALSVPTFGRWALISERCMMNEKVRSRGEAALAPERWPSKRKITKNRRVRSLDHRYCLSSVLVTWYGDLQMIDKRRVKDNRYLNLWTMSTISSHGCQWRLVIIHIQIIYWIKYNTNNTCFVVCRMY